MLLSIDCGSTNLKAARFDDQLNRVADAAVPLVYSRRDSDVVEFEAATFWQAAEQCIDQVGGQPDTDRIAITSQAQTFTLVDDRDQPLIPFISWIDKRAGAEADQLASELSTGFHRHCSFPYIIPQLALAKLRWLQQRDRLHGRVVTLPGFIALKLAGINVTDRNLAAMSGVYSLATNDWWPDAIEAVGLTRNQLPRLVDVGDAVDNIIFAGNDQTAGAYGVLGDATADDDRLLLTLGTALVVYRLAGQDPGPFSRTGCWGPYPGTWYYELATRDEGCAALDWAIEQLMPGTDPDTFRAEGATAEPFSAWFDPQRIGQTDAWGGSSDRAARARAVIEGISFSVRELIEEDLEVPRGRATVIAAGGGSASDWWLQILADVLGCRIERGWGDALFGAARMAGGATALSRQSGKAFDPSNRPAQFYADCYPQWRQWRTRTATG